MSPERRRIRAGTICRVTLWDDIGRPPGIARNRVKVIAIKRDGYAGIIAPPIARAEWVEFPLVKLEYLQPIEGVTQ